MPRTKKPRIGAGLLAVLDDSRVQKNKASPPKPTTSDSPEKRPTPPSVQDRKQVYIDAETRDLLRLKAFQERRTESSIIREALRKFFGLAWPVE